MFFAFLSLCIGLIVLVWSADRFVDGSSSLANHLGMPPLLIGMVVVGFGTSAPEMVVSAQAALNGNPGIALGNAFGSNIANIALILGLTAVIMPIDVHARVLRKELPILTGITALVAFLLYDAVVSRADALLMLAVFGGLMTWAVWQGFRSNGDPLSADVRQELQIQDMSLGRALIWLAVGLVFLIGSSRLLVWGAVEIAHAFGVSDLIVGLTIIALGTSLPELASSIAACRKGEDDIALGNVLGSNLFNTLAVIGIAGSIHPMDVEPAVMSRDMPVMIGLTLSLFLIGYGFRKPGRITRRAGIALLACYVGYNAFLAKSILLP
jgi:cation:H+ antiporter